MIEYVKALKSKIKSKLIYYLWRIKNPKEPFSKFYISVVKKKIKSAPHPTIGLNIKEKDRFETTAKIEKSFLINQGLLPTHKFVDYGCGSLRLGKEIIPYLNKGNYIGLDMTNHFYDLGKELIKKNVLKQKRPVFRTINEKSITQIKNEGIDFLMSNAVLYHVPPSELKQYFSKIIYLLKPEGIAFIDFTNGKNVKKRSMMTWIYPYKLLDSLVKNVNGETKLHKLQEDASIWYPDRHFILEIKLRKNGR